MLLGLKEGQWVLVQRYCIIIIIIIYILIGDQIHRPIPPVRSMSLPAVVPNLCLLGSFEVNNKSSLLLLLINYLLLIGVSTQW